MPEETTSERVRPCVKCGALLGFQSERCPECGAALPAVSEREERVESCMACGVMVAFGTARCPECGGDVRIPFDQAEEQVKPCVECGELVTFADVYCLQCGKIAGGVEVPEIPPRVDHVAVATGTEAWVDRGSLVVLAVAGAALGLAAFLLLRG